MTLFLDAATSTAVGGGMPMLLMVVIMFAVFYFFVIRPENKKKKKTEEMRNSLTLGDEIITIGSKATYDPEDELVPMRLVDGKSFFASDISELSHYSLFRYLVGMSRVLRGKDTHIGVAMIYHIIYQARYLVFVACSRHGVDNGEYVPASFFHSLQR